MKIAVIGAGNVGKAIARAGVGNGHEVTVTATDPGHAAPAAADAGATAAASVAEAATGADVIVLAVPASAAGAVAGELDGTSAVVVDVTNPLNADASGLTVTERSAAELLQERLPTARVVKAFNTVFAANQAAPEVDGTPLDGFYAGDDAEAKPGSTARLSGASRLSGRGCKFVVGWVAERGRPSQDDR
ncbi:MAG: NADPH-dependent F420 reductase [Frankiaceae bacterium]